MRAPEDLATFRWMQESELKHCRIAMVASILWPLSELDICQGEREIKGFQPFSGQSEPLRW